MVVLDRPQPHWEEVLAIYPAALDSYNNWSKSFSRTELKEYVNWLNRKTGKTYPEMVRDEAESPSEEFYMENFIDRFHGPEPRGLFDFLYVNNDGWSVQPERTEDLLIETGRVKPSRVGDKPPELVRSYPRGISGKPLREIFVQFWAENDKEFEEDDPMMSTIDGADYTDENARSVVVDFLEIEDPILTSWIYMGTMNFKELGEMISEQILEMEEENEDLAERTVMEMFKKRENVTHFTKLLESNNGNVREYISKNLLTSFAREYRDVEETPKTIRDMTGRMISLLRDGRTGEHVREQFKKNKLKFLRVSNYKVYCKFLESLTSKLAILQDPFRYETSSIYEDDCKF